MAEEPETYDLAFDPEDPSDSSPETPAKPAKPIAKPAASSEPDTFELDDVEPEIRDPRAGNTPSRPPKPPINPTPDMEDDTPEEPATVSPAKAQAKREDERRRAAQELAEADARKKKLIMTLASAFVGVGILAYIALKLFG